MIPMRYAAVRLLSSRVASVAARPHPIRSFASLSSKSPRIVSSIQFQRRWATGEAEAKEDDLPVSQLQPTPQEEVENAIHEDNAAVAEDGNVEPAQEQTRGYSMGSSAGRNTSDRNSSDRNSSEGRPFREPPTPKPTIYVGNLFFDVTENDLSKEFARFGTIKRVRIIRDVRGLSKGFAYIELESTENAAKAIEELNQQLYEGRRLMVSYAHSDQQVEGRPVGRDYKAANAPSKTLFIGNMSFEMTDRDLNNLFRGIRNVIDVRVAIDRRTGQPRGFAHADFIDIKSAMEAMKVLSGKENYGRKLRIDYSYGPSTAPRNTPQ